MADSAGRAVSVELLTKRLPDEEAEEGKAKGHDAAAMPQHEAAQAGLCELKITCRHGSPPLLTEPTTGPAWCGSGGELSPGQESADSAQTGLFELLGVPDMKQGDSPWR